jgi:DNA-binding MarR family transcriptional regulator
MSPLGIRYLNAIDDWKAPYEVAEMLGGGRSLKTVSATLFSLVGRGLAKHSRDNNTFRITDAGRDALTSLDGRKQ